MRPLFIAGNWKMNPVSLESAMALGEAVVGGVGQEAHVRVAICPPFLYLKGLDETLSNTPVGLGAQNMSDKESGAYTGEVSGPMLQDLGCTHVILGHSERRHGMGETDAQVNAKLHAALKVKLLPIVCIGELLEEREAGKTEEVVRTQLEGSLAEITPEQMGEVVLAYEPVWAIGTGKVATPRAGSGGSRIYSGVAGRAIWRGGGAAGDHPVWWQREAGQRGRVAGLPGH